MPERRRPVAAVYAPETNERDRSRVTPCCAKCRRGMPGHGVLQCGFPNGCPNPKCAHHTPTELIRLLNDLQDLGYPETENN